MDPQSIDEFMEYILALKNKYAHQTQQQQTVIKNLQEELKNLKVTSKPLKEPSTKSKN